MSIIYEALKKVEGQKEISSSESTPQSITLPVEREEKKVNKEKKMFFLPAALLLVVLGIWALSFILPPQEQVQEQEGVASVAEKREIDSARVYRIPESRSQAPGEVILREGPVQGYILEGIVYDEEASFAIISGKVIRETDTLGSFRIDKISKDRVDMTNIKNNNKVTLSLP